MKNKLRELRKNQKLTQEELANLIGISRQAINAIEKEKFDPSKKNSSSIGILNSFDILNAVGKLGSNFSFSIAFIA